LVQDDIRRISLFAPFSANAENPQSGENTGRERAAVASTSLFREVPALRIREVNIEPAGSVRGIDILAKISVSGAVSRSAMPSGASNRLVCFSSRPSAWLRLAKRNLSPLR
jgi:hypothetical protein